jgi:hypothetical protein
MPFMTTPLDGGIHIDLKIMISDYHLVYLLLFVMIFNRN